MKHLLSIFAAFFILCAPLQMVFAAQPGISHEVAAPAYTPLGKQEKKAVKKELKQKIKALKKNKAADTNTILLAIVAILLPPLAVILFEGSLTVNFWIDLILTFLGWLPGVIYALYIILS